jgi:hypothetical protein
VLLGDSGVNGTVHFTQSMPLGKVKVTGEIHGLDKNSLRGFHIQYVLCLRGFATLTYALLL